MATEGTPYTTIATYNDAGELTTQTYPNGDTLTTSYDPSSGWATGESVQLSGAQSATPLLANETYSGTAGAMGLLTSATLGAFSGGSGAYAASYDLLGRLTSSQSSYTPSGGSATTLYQTRPTYDLLGNVIEATTTLPQGMDTQVFCYDDLSRLTWAGSTGTPACSGDDMPKPMDIGSLTGTSAAYSASYSYDTLNRLTAAPLGSYTYGDSAHADAATAIGSAWSASYDAAGDMTCRAASSATTCAGSSPTGAALSYDNEGRLAGWQNTPGNSPTQSVAYLYDGTGQRVQQVATANGTTTTTSYIGSLEEVTSSGSTTTTTAYYGALAESINGALTFLLRDALGSVTETAPESIGPSGPTLATQLYGPYGAVREQSGTLPTSKGYTGQRADTATSGLDYYGARYYDAVAGQFTSADTTLAGGLNRYAYVAGNPETTTDPTGHVYTMPKGGAPTICTSYEACVPPPSGTPSPPTGSGAGGTLNPPPPSAQSPAEAAAQAGGFAADLEGAKVAMSQSNQKSLINYFVQLIKKYSHSKWSRAQRPLRNVENNLADAEEGADILGKLGSVLIVLGAVLDAAQYAITFYDSNNLPAVTGFDRVLASLVAGVIHSVIVTSVTVGATVFVGALFSDTFVLAPVIAFAAGLGAGWLATRVADQVVPKIMNEVWNPVGSPPTASVSAAS